MIEAVLFDLGGTLHCSENSRQRELWFANRLLERLSDYGIFLEVTPEVFSDRLKTNAEAYKRETEISLRELSAPIIWNDYYLREYKIGRETLEPIAEELSFLYDYERPKILRRPHLRETMAELKCMGLRLCVVSNNIYTSVVPHFLREYGIDGLMECVVTSSETGHRKPGREIFAVAERAMGLSPEALAYVGDTVSRDVRGVRNAGWHTVIQISNAASAHRDACMAGLGFEPDYRIDDLSRVPEIINAENEKENCACAE